MMHHVSFNESLQLDVICNTSLEQSSEVKIHLKEGLFSISGHPICIDSLQSQQVPG